MYKIQSKSIVLLWFLQTINISSNKLKSLKNNPLFILKRRHFEIIIIELILANRIMFSKYFFSLQNITVREIWYKNLSWEPFARLTLRFFDYSKLLSRSTEANMNAIARKIISYKWNHKNFGFYKCWVYYWLTVF